MAVREREYAGSFAKLSQTTETERDREAEKGRQGEREGEREREKRDIDDFFLKKTPTE